MSLNKLFRQDFLIVYRVICIYLFLFFHQMKLTFTAHSDMTFICSLEDTTHSLISKYLFKSFFLLYLSGLIRRGQYESTCFFFFLGCRKTCTVSVYFCLIYLVSRGIDGKRERSFFWVLYSRKTWTFLLLFNPHEIFWLS